MQFASVSLRAICCISSRLSFPYQGRLENERNALGSKRSAWHHGHAYPSGPCLHPLSQDAKLFIIPCRPNLRRGQTTRKESFANLLLPLQELALRNRDGTSVTTKTADVQYAAKAAVDSGMIPTSARSDFSGVDLLDQPGERTWPITLFSYIYARQDLKHLGNSGAPPFHLNHFMACLPNRCRMPRALRTRLPLACRVFLLLLKLV